MNSESTIVASWLYSTLAGDAQLMAAAPGGVWEDLAPAGTALPVIIFHIEPAGAVAVLPVVRIASDFDCTVKAVVAGWSAAPLEPLASRIEALLHRAGATGGPPAGPGILSCVRDQPLRYLEDADGNIYRHLGGQYHIQAQEA